LKEIIYKDILKYIYNLIWLCMHLISVEAVASTEKKALIIGHMPMINRAWMHIHIFFPQN
jgi:hypothetical protein